MQGKAKQGINSLLPISRQELSHLQESRAPSRIKVTWDDRCCNSEHPTLPPQLLLLSTASYVMGSPFGQLGSAVPAVSPPSPLCTPDLLAGGAAGEAEKTLTLCEHCSATAKTLLCYQD